MDIIIESAASSSTDVVYLPEVAGVTFLACVSGPVSMFLNRIRCQAKFPTSAKFLTYYFLSGILLLRVKE